MNESSTHTYQRVVIWVIAIVLAVGTLGAYFLVILQNKSSQSQSTQSSASTNTSTQDQGGTVDPTAFKVDGKVAQLQVIDEKVGTGDEVKPSDTVTVHYKGTIAQTGVKFDSSYDRGEPASFGLDGVIPGWSQGMVGMKVGGKRRLIIPSELGYGAQANGPIPANSDLVFEVELLSVKHSQ